MYQNNKNKIKYCTAAVVLPLLILTSCNFYRIRDTQLTRKFIKAGLKSSVYKHDNTSIHYWAGGNGETLVLLHGFGASAKFQWYPQIKSFAQRYRLIIPDLIYFGKSNSASNDFSVEFQADMMYRLLDHLNIRSFKIIGLSYGGLVSVTMVSRHPERVTALILCDSPVKFYSARDNEKALQEFGASTIQELLVPGKPDDIPRMLKIAYYRPPWTPRFVLPNVHENMFTNQAREKGMLLEHLKINEASFKKRDYTVNCKVLLIWGRHDLLIPTRIGSDLETYFGTASHLEIVEKAAHMPNMEQPKIFNRLVFDFLDRQ